MLDKSRSQVPQWAASTFRRNGKGGVEGFIEMNSKPKPRRNISRAWNNNVRKFVKNGSTFMWNKRLITSQILDISKLNTQKITFIDKNEIKE